MFNKLSNLIKKHYYTDRETAISKVDTCWAMGKITDGQYVDLTMLIDEEYPLPEAIEEPNTPTTDEVE